MTLSEHMLFLNKASVTRILSEVEAGAEVPIDGSRSVMIDYGVKEVLRDFLVRAKAENITVHLKGIDEDRICNQPEAGH